MSREGIELKRANYVSRLGRGSENTGFAGIVASRLDEERRDSHVVAVVS